MKKGSSRRTGSGSISSADLTGKDLLVAGFFDPSIGIGESSDYKALVTVGLERQEMIFYVLDAYIRRGSLDEALRAACARHEQRRYWLLGVEDNLFQKLLLREFDRLGQERGVILPVRGVTAKTAKGDSDLPSERPGGARPDPLLPGPGQPGFIVGAVALFPGKNCS